MGLQLTTFHGLTRHFLRFNKVYHCVREQPADVPYCSQPVCLLTDKIKGVICLNFSSTARVSEGKLERDELALFQLVFTSSPSPTDQ